MAKVGRNDPCPCGSGKKYKKCCGSPLKPQRITVADPLPGGSNVLQRRGAQEPIEVKNNAPPQGKVPTSETDDDVEELVSIAGLTDAPEYVTYQDFGYESDWCHVSAKHRALVDGGKRVHGWIIWQFEELALAEFHSVWEDSEGNLVDVTPPTYGQDRVLFVRDRGTRIEEHDGIYRLPTNWSSIQDMPHFLHGEPTSDTFWPLDPATHSLVNYCKKLDIPVEEILTDDHVG